MWMSYSQMRVMALIAVEENPTSYVMDFFFYSSSSYA